MSRWIVSGAVTIVAILAIVLFVSARKPAVDVGEAGIFENDCCGTVKLLDGKMVLNDQATVRYDVGTDGQGPYILPRTYVGVVDNEGFDVDGSRSLRKLRLDRLPAPTRIMLYEGPSPYAFVEKKTRGRKL